MNDTRKLEREVTRKTLGMHSHRENFPCDQMTSPEGRHKRKKNFIHVTQETNNVLYTSRLNIKNKIVHCVLLSFHIHILE